MSEVVLRVFFIQRTKYKLIRKVNLNIVSLSKAEVDEGRLSRVDSSAMYFY